MTIELEGDRDERFTIDSMEVKETANDEGIFVLCNYVSGCEYEFQDDAELRPNTLSHGFVLKGTLHLTYQDLDTGNDETEVLEIRADLNPTLITEEEGDEYGAITRYYLRGDLEIGGMGLTSLLNLGSKAAFGTMNVTDDGNAELSVKAF